MTMSDDMSTDVDENSDTSEDTAGEAPAAASAAESSVEASAPAEADSEHEALAVDVDESADDTGADAADNSNDAAEPDVAAAADAPEESKTADAAVTEVAAADADDGATTEAPAADNAIGEDELLADAVDDDYENPFDKPGRWYVVHTQSGYEKKVKQNLEARTASMNMEGRIYETVIPMDDVVEFKGGKKVVVQKKMFPGYLLVRCELDDDSWYVVRNTPGIVNFVGAGGKPSPLRRREVETFLGSEPAGSQELGPKVKAKLAFSLGETVRVKEGPFADFTGEVVEINEDQLRVKVLVNIFGRETPVELEFGQVARL